MNSESTGHTLDRYRSYLQFLASTQLDPRLQGKLAASDLVQQTLLQAYQSYGEFRGTTPEELGAWLRQILGRNMARARRDFGRDKRDVARERALDASLAESSRRLENWFIADELSPVDDAGRKEYGLRLTEALHRLADAQYTAVVLHYWNGWSLADIALHLDQTPAATAGILKRALKQLRTELRSWE